MALLLPGGLTSTHRAAKLAHPGENSSVTIRHRHFVAATAAVAALLVPGFIPPAHAHPPRPDAASVLATAVRSYAAELRAHEQLVPLQAEEAWRHSTGAGVVVAVVDSGVDAEHPGLAGRVLPGSDHVDGRTDGRVDPVGHGTTVASLIAGRDGETVTGLAPDAKILPVRVLDEENRYRSGATVAAGVRWAVDHGAQVINLSLGGQGYSAALSAALDIAIANDVVVVACTGNSPEAGPNQVWYPAREPGVVAVSGLTRTPNGALTHWPDSLTGPETVLSAPAVVTGARPRGVYQQVQGTSFASALVAASAALLRAHWPDMPAGEVVLRLVATAQDLGPPGRDPRYGFGAVDPAAALTEQVSRVYGNPLDTKARHGTGGFGAAPDQVQRPVAAGAVRSTPAEATGAASAAVTANPVLGSSAAAAKITPSTSPVDATSGPPELPLRTSARMV